MCTRPSYLLVFRSSRMMSRMKLDCDGSAEHGSGGLLWRSHSIGYPSAAMAWSILVSLSRGPALPASQTAAARLCGRTPPRESAGTSGRL